MLADGTTHRVATNATLSGGLLSAATLGGDFTPHFTEMLQTERFKNLVLGDGGTDGTVDTVKFSGSFAKYSLAALNASGEVVANPHANWASVLAIKVTDNRTDADLLDANGVPLLDANGDPLVLEGTDIVVGVEKFQFADQTINPAVYFDQAPVLDLRYVPVPSVVVVASDNFNGNGTSYARGTGWTGSWVELNDGNTNPGSGDIQDSNNSITFGTSIDGNEAIRRAVNLTGQTGATLGFDYTMSDLEAGKNVRVEAWNSALNSGTGGWDIIASFLGSGNGTTSSGHRDIVLTANEIGSASQIRFRAEGAWSGTGGSDGFTIDNVSITTPGPLVDQFPGFDNNAAYTEQLVAAAITINPLVSDPDDTLIFSATAHIHEAIAGDRLIGGTLPASITAVGSGTGTITLTSTAGASFSDFQSALAAITFSSTSDNPTNADRHIDVTVSDGLKDSAVATTTVTVTPVNDPTVTGADVVITNIAAGNTSASNIAIADWALLANDSDPDSALTISGIGNGVGGIATNGNGAGHGGTTTTVRDSSAGGGTFTYTVNGVTGYVSLSQDTSGALDGSAGNDIIVGNGASSAINGGSGNDIIFAGAGNDTVTGGIGNDTLEGGTGDDAFVFAPGFGNDTITGFDASPAGGGQDFVDLAGFGITAGNFANNVGITYGQFVGGGASALDARITIGADTIVLASVTGVGPNTLTVDDFHFV